MKKLRKLLVDAEGRSEFAIVLVCDIRGFSEFSTRHESPDTAMFIKKFYLKLIDDYFPTAHYAKPTGDGLLLIFKYSEKTLQNISAEIFQAIFKCLNDFADLFNADPMINFDTPKFIGFGVSRGPVCCLFSGKEIIDYSGQLLNLASRLMDLARPKGIVVHNAYKLEVIPEEFRNQFKTESVYVRGIAEETPISIFHCNEVSLPESCLHQLKAHVWKEVIKQIRMKELIKLEGNFRIQLSEKCLLPSKIKIGIKFDHPKVPGYKTTYPIEKYVYKDDATGPHILLEVTEAQQIVNRMKIKPNAELVFTVQFVPKKKEKRRKSIKRSLSH
ncbi:hypothetical protein METP3_02990 [Methanosarcinales archaeon]|nr:hypothetical protein METP3_02990 [Methanosarcinales archaeon]